MFQLPTLQPCDGLPLWLTAEDDVTQALVLWWRSGIAWVVHGPSSGPGVPSDDQVDAA